jgi:hypothetical protein
MVHRQLEPTQKIIKSGVRQENKASKNMFFFMRNQETIRGKRNTQE